MYKYLISTTLFLVIVFVAMGSVLQAQHYEITPAGADQLIISTHHNKPCSVSPAEFPNLVGFQIRHFDLTGNISAESKYVTNDLSFQNLLSVKIININASKYLVTAVVESTTHSNAGHILYMVVDQATGNILSSKVIEISNAHGGKMWIGSVTNSSNAFFVSGTSAVVTGNYSTQIFIVKATINPTNNNITANWVRSYYTPDLPQGGTSQPSICYETQINRLTIVQVDEPGKLLFFRINPSNGVITEKKITSITGYKIKEAIVKTFPTGLPNMQHKCLFIRADNNNNASLLTVAKIGLVGPSIVTPKSYSFSTSWTLNSVDFTSPNLLVGMTDIIGKKYNWLQFNVSTLVFTAAKTYTPQYLYGTSIYSGSTIFSVAANGSSRFVLTPSANCETALTPTNSTTIPTVANTTISAGLNNTTPTVRNITIQKLAGTSTKTISCN